MTKKLEKKLKKIALIGMGSMLSIITLGVVGTRLLSIQKTQQTLKLSENNSQKAENIEIITGNNKPKVISASNVATDGAIICDSLIQGARDNNLEDGNYIFRVTRKNRRKYRDNRLQS